MMLNNPLAWAKATMLALAVAPDRPIVDQLVDSGCNLAGESYLEAIQSALLQIDAIPESDASQELLRGSDPPNRPTLTVVVSARE